MIAIILYTPTCKVLRENTCLLGSVNGRCSSHYYTKFCYYQCNPVSHDMCKEYIIQAMFCNNHAILSVFEKQIFSTVSE